LVDYRYLEISLTGSLLTRVFEPLQGKQPVCWVVQRIQVGPISSRRAGKRHFPNQQSTVTAVRKKIDP